MSTWDLSLRADDMKLLLHVCCGPCMTSFDRFFKENGIEYTGFFYNPNIHPYKEFIKRMDALREYTDALGLEVAYDPQFMQAKWEHEFEGIPAAQRCALCYRQRLGRTAWYAARNGFTHFTSTLLISPYQDHGLITSIGLKAAEEYGIGFYYKDFREFFREGQSIAREEGIYRQKYCGCIYSFKESKFKDKITWD